MITKEEQYKLLREDISRAEKAGLIVQIKYHNSDSDFLVLDARTSDVFAELLGYLRQAYPDIGFRQIDRYVHYTP